MVILGTNTSTTSPMIRHTTNGSLEAIRGEELKDRGRNEGDIGMERNDQGGEVLIDK